MDSVTASKLEATKNSSNEETMDYVEDFTNDPLKQDTEPVRTPTPKIKKKKGPGQPKKGHSKVIGLPKKCYNTRQKAASNSDANAEDNTS